MTRDAPACPAATLRVRNLIHDTVLRDALECSRTSSSALTGDFAMWCASTRVLTSADAATARVEDHTGRRAGNGVHPRRRTTLAARGKQGGGSRKLRSSTWESGHSHLRSYGASGPIELDLTSEEDCWEEDNEMDDDYNGEVAADEEDETTEVAMVVEEDEGEGSGEEGADGDVNDEADMLEALEEFGEAFHGATWAATKEAQQLQPASELPTQEEQSDHVDGTELPLPLRRTSRQPLHL